MNPNITSFALKSFSGEFGVKPKEIIVNNLSINTTNSDVSLNAKINGVNIFDSTMTEELKYALVDISLDSKKFNFGDVSAFVSAVDMMKGSLGLQLRVSGNLLQLNVNKIILDYEKTHLETKAIIHNIDNVDKMTVSANFQN
jgi:hypothetical protein